MDRFQLVSDFKPAGDQPAAIEGLVEGLEAGLARQTLLGVTGSGKTFTMANVIQTLQRPTLILRLLRVYPSTAELTSYVRPFFVVTFSMYF